MRKITSQAIKAFTTSRNFTSGATQVISNDDLTLLLLHGNTIARRDVVGTCINLCGWNTKTTRERLNGLPNVYVSTCKGQAYLNGDPIPSDGWVKVSG